MSTTEKNVPFTKKQVEELPKGFHPSDLPGRKFFRDMRAKRIMLTQLGMVKLYPPNCRPLTEARKEYKQLKFGRLCGFATINPLELFGNKTRCNAHA